MSPTRLTLSFELARTLRKPSFWIAALALPCVVAIVGALILAGSRTSAIGPGAGAPFRYSDPANTVDPSVARAAGGVEVSSPEAIDRAERLPDGRAYIAFPADPAAGTITVLAPDHGPIENAAWATLAHTILQESAARTVADPALTRALTGQVPVVTKTLVDGRPARSFGAVLPLLLFPLLLFVVMTISGNRMLLATLEEKETRVVEMLLVASTPLQFIAGKLMALAALTAIQLAVMAVPLVGILVGATRSGDLPFLGSVELAVEPVPMLVGAVVFVGGLAVLTGVLVGIGALSSSAKEASPFYAIFVVLMVVPIYAWTSLLGTPDAPIVQVLLYFPITAPLTALVLNATGALSGTATITVAIELLVLGGLAVAAAAWMFRRGAIDAPPLLRLRRRPVAVR